MGEHKGKKERYAKYREYKNQGHTVKEVSERFGISESTAATACRGMEPHKSKDKRKNQYTCATFDREQNAAKMIEERAPGFEYAGGFTSCDGYVFIRCKKCGALLRRSMITIRKREAACNNCKSINKAEQEKRRREEKEAKEQAKQDRHNEIVKRDAIKRAQREEKRNARKHACPICGRETTNKFCCSVECSNKRHDRIKENRRRTKQPGTLIDKDITIQALYERDKGTCYICGGLCDWNDKKEKDGSVICGNEYPSIDHVKPLSCGGLHSWDNVRLAHRICNSRKGAMYIPLG